MPTIVVGTEKNFSELRPVLLPGRGVSAAAAAEVAEAIKEANPQVDLDRLQPGTVLTVPEGLPGVKVEPQTPVVVSTPPDGPVGALPSRGKVELDALAAAAKARDAAAKAERKRLAKAVESPKLAAAMKRDKQLASDVDSARNAMAEEEAKAKERAATLKKAQAEWQAGLASLQDSFQQLPGVSVVQSRAKKTSRSSPS
jgi:hypothetical protein